ncbi:MAG: hypothetical protein OXB96_00055 [Candidatus Kaiserbacteria bacterium]|nr:hypothetical protein [Candidatus Kaiserbacteria bacterium]
MGIANAIARMIAEIRKIAGGNFQKIEKVHFINAETGVAVCMTRCDKKWIADSAEVKSLRNALGTLTFRNSTEVVVVAWSDVLEYRACCRNNTVVTTAYPC